MATVINNPSTSDRADSSGVGLIVGIIVALAIIALALLYGIPALRGGASSVSQPASGTLNVDVPGVGSGSASGSGSMGGSQ